MKECAIGVFDSGAGGLALVNELNLLLPSERILYFSENIDISDAKEEKEALKKYTQDKIEKFKKYDVKFILSCSSEVNTVYAHKFPQTDLRYSGTFLPAAQTACGATRTNKIAVIGSALIIKKGGYAKIIKNIRQNITVMGVTCPVLTEFVLGEKDLLDQEMFENSTREIFERLREEKIDTVILADGYYTLIRDKLLEICGDSFALVSPYEETAKKVYNDLLEADLLTDSEELPDNVIYAEENEEHLKKSADIFLKRASKISKSSDKF